MKTICINNGYYQYKSENKQIFKTRLTKCLFQNIRTTSDILLSDNETYIVGEGEININKDKTQSEFTKILILNMLSRFTDKNDEEFNLVLSCPPSLYVRQSELLPKFLIGEYNIIWNNTPKNIKINNVFVFPETVCSYISNDVGQYAKKQVMVIDIGGYTTNIVRLKDSNFTEDDIIPVETGMYYINEEICKYLNSNYSDLHCDIDDIEYGRINGLHLLGNREKDIMIEEQEDIEDIYFKHIMKILNKCDIKNWNYKTYDVLVTGGGGYNLFYLVHEILPQAILSNDPLFDNLNGLKILAREVY